MLEEAEALLAYAETHEMRMEDRRIVVEVLKRSEAYMDQAMHRRFELVRDSVRRSLSRQRGTAQ